MSSSKSESKKTDNVEEKIDEIINRMEALENENKELKEKQNEILNAEKAALIKDLESADTGLEKEDLESLSVNSLKKLHAKKCEKFNALGFSVIGNSQDNSDDELPKMEIN